MEPCRDRLCRGRLCTCPSRCFLNDQEHVRSIRAPPRPAAQLQAPQSLVAGWITHYSSQDERFRGNLNSTAPTPFSVIDFISIQAKFSQKEDGLTSPLDNPTDISVFSSDEHAPVKTKGMMVWVKAPGMADATIRLSPSQGNVSGSSSRPVTRYLYI